MVRWAELFWGGVLFAYSVFWFFNPGSIFELEKRVGSNYLSVKNTDNLELSQEGAVRRQLIAAGLAVLGFVLILDAVVYQAM